MKYILSLFLLLLSFDGFCQDLSKNNFDEKLLSTLNQKYNVSKLPAGFYSCAYSIYERNKDDSFFVGNNVAIQCLPKYVSKIEFSDDGQKMWNITIGHFTRACKENNEKFKDRMNVNNYCNCLVKQYNEHSLKLKTLIDPKFARSELFRRIATHCVSQNRIN